MTTTDQAIAGLNIIIDSSDLTKTQACEIADVSTETLRRFLTRKTTILLTSLVAVCNAYGHELEDVLVLGRLALK